LQAGHGVATGRRNDPIIPKGVWSNEQANIITLDGTDYEGEAELALVAALSDAEGLEPRTIHEARSRPDWPDWNRGIQKELRRLESAGTWRVVPRPEGVNVVGSKWVFRVKKDAAGNATEHKARLVAQGYTQVPGVDYFDTFAPVAKLVSLRIVLSLAARYDWEIHQLDVKSAYLNGELAEGERIFMKQPPGYEIPGKEDLVLELKKTIYGLKQSGRRWYEVLCKTLYKIGFQRTQSDHAVFFTHLDDGIVILVIHVDDITTVTSSKNLMQDTKRKLMGELDMTDNGEVHWILGLEVKRNREERTISLSQRSYIRSIIARYGLEDAKALSTPMDPSVNLSRSQCPQTTNEIAEMRNIPYREAIGSLMYASQATRPDISFAVTLLSKFSDNPGRPHWEAVKRVFRYLNGTHDLWLTYGARTEELHGFADADGNSQEDRHAISGYAFLIDGAAVSWSSKRQNVISLSTTEAEYVAATHAAKEAIWIRSFIGELLGDSEEPTTLFSDNQSAIKIAKDSQYHARTKHIDIRFHFIRWIIEKGTIKLVYRPTEEMTADTLTKPLPSTKAKHFAAALGLGAA